MGTKTTRLAVYLSGALAYLGIALSTHAQIKPPPDTTSTARQPTQIDLRAAYCRPVVANTIGMLAQSLSDENMPANLRNAATEQHAAAITRSRRLELYILPRINVVDSAGLIAAQTRGKVDAARFSEWTQGCDLKCKSTADTQMRISCTQQCNEGSDVVTRVRDCDDVSWLPMNN